MIEEKNRKYLTHGSDLVLDVDPAVRVVYAYWRDGNATFRVGERFSCAAVPWLEFDVNELFENLTIPR